MPQSFSPLEGRSNKIGGARQRATNDPACTLERMKIAPWRSAKKVPAADPLLACQAFEQSGFGSPGSLPSTWPTMSLLSS